MPFTGYPLNASRQMLAELRIICPPSATVSLKARLQGRCQATAMSSVSGHTIRSPSSLVEG
jgi:hypothetical protein